MNTFINMWTALLYTWPIWVFIGFLAAVAITVDVAARGCSNGDIDTTGRDQALRVGGHR